MKIPNSHYLIIDLEATCSDDGFVPRHEMEIIEIGAVIQNAQTFEIESEFQSFVQPVRHPVLTEFCTTLTNIRQEQVFGSRLFTEVMALLNMASSFPPPNLILHPIPSHLACHRAIPLRCAVRISLFEPYFIGRD